MIIWESITSEDLYHGISKLADAGVAMRVVDRSIVEDGNNTVGDFIWGDYNSGKPLFKTIVGYKTTTYWKVQE